MKRKILSLLIFSILLNSCANLTDEISQSENFGNTNAGNTILVTGDINFSGSLPAEMVEKISGGQSTTVAKSAVPSIPVGAKYMVKAECAGKASVEAEATPNDETGKWEFAISLTEGNWTITATLRSGVGTEAEKILLKDSVTKNLTAGNTTVTLSFYLKPLSEGTGHVYLTLNFEDSVLDSIRISSIGQNLGKSITINTGATSYVYNVDQDIPCGSYEVTFYFYKNSALVYSTTQVINVFSNMTTDRWVAGGGAGGPINAAGDFEVTSTMTSQFMRNTFYVNGTSGNDDNGGGPYAPVKTLSKAVALANASAEAGTKNIYVKAGGSETLAQTIVFSKDINVEVYSEKPGDKTGNWTITRGAGDFDTSMIYVENVPVLLEGLVIDGNNVQISNTGAGIYNKSGDLTLKNVDISDCRLTGDESKGGGIFNTGTLTFDGGSIKGCTADDGGGLYTQGSGTATLKNVTVSGCTATSSGGAIYLNSGTIDLEDNTVIGAVKYASEIGITACAKADSYSNNANHGAGIYEYGGQLNIKDSACISYNYATGNGGGIYMYSGTCKMTGGAIQYNYSVVEGGGICMNGTLDFSGGEIKGNEAGSGIGNGIYNYTSTLKISGAAKADVDNDVYLNGSIAIKITGNLTSEGIVASISKGGTLTAGNTILSADSAVLIADNIGKFEMATSGWGIVQGSGENATKGLLQPVLYVAGPEGKHSTYVGNGSDSNAGTKAKPFATLSKAYSAMTADDTIIYVDGETESLSVDNTGAGSKSFTVAKYPNATTAKITYKKNGTFITTNKSIAIKDVIILYSPENIDEARAISLEQSGITLTLEDTKIQNFKKDNGAGVNLVSGASVELKGTTSITNCTATNGKGGGIYAMAASSKIYLQDSVYLDSTSDIRLNGNGYVTLKGDLTPPEEAYGVVATLTPEFYSPDDDPSLGSYIKLLYEETTGLIAGNYKKFKVKPGAEKNWSISKDGKLLDIIVVENINSLKTELADDTKYTMDSSTFIVSSSDISDKTLFNIESLNVSIDGGNIDSHGKIDLRSVQGRAFTISGNCDVKISNIDFASNHDGSSYSTSYYGNYHGTGILVKSGAVVTIENCTFEKLSVDIFRWSDPGNTGFAGIIEVENGGKVIIKNCIIKNSKLLSSGSWGGAVCIQEGGTAEISDTKIEQIIGGHAGGALMVGGECTMNNCTIVSNKSGDGAGIYLFNVSDSAYSAHLLAENCIIKSNDASESRTGSGRHGGAGYINCNGIAEFKNCEITENSSYSSGKAFYVERGTLKLDETSRNNINSTHNIVVKSSATYNDTTYGEDTTISNP